MRKRRDGHVRLRIDGRVRTDNGRSVSIRDEGLSGIGYTGGGWSRSGEGK